MSEINEEEKPRWKRKWLFVVFVVAALVAGACLVINGIIDDDPEPKSFTEYLAEDFAYAKSMENDSNRVFFYEVETILNKEASDTTGEKLNVIAMTSVFQLHDSVYYRTRNLLTGDVEDTKEFGKWFGSMEIKSVDFPVSFDSAVSILFNSGATVPAANKLILRNPTSSDWGAPQWIFGTYGTNFVFIDSYTGEVFSDVDSLFTASGVEMIENRDSLIGDSITISDDSATVDSIG